MLCGLFFSRIRARLTARKRLREERQRGANDSKLTKKPSIQTPAPESAGVAASILGKLPVTPPRKAPESPIDPESAYLIRLPRELKLEIIDHVHSRPTGFVKDPTEVAFSKRVALANLRLTCREFADVAAPALFQRLRLTGDLLDNKRRRKEFLVKIVPLIASHVRLLWVELQPDGPDEDLATIISLLQNLTWVSVTIGNEGESKTVAALEALPDLRKLTLRMRAPYPGHEYSVFQRLSRAHGNRMTALYLHFDWGYINGPGVFNTIRDNLPRLTTLHVVAARGSNIDVLLLDEKPWACQDVLTSIHFQELTELEASLVPKMVDRFRNVTHLVISSCGPFGTYGDARGKEKALESVMRNLPKVKRRQPLEGLRIVHFTDMEARLMSPTPTVELVVNDPLDQMLLGPLLQHSNTFPGLRKLTLEYIDDGSGEARGLLEKACRERGVELVVAESARDVSW